MKRTLLTALLIPGLTLGLAACSSDKDDNKADMPTGLSTSISPASPGASTASTAAPVPAASRTMGAAPANAQDADVKMTKCESTSTGVEMTAEIKNTTDKKRMYILTGLAYDEKKKLVASAALMGQDAIDAGKSATITGKSAPVKVKGKLTCEVSEINSLPQG